MKAAIKHLITTVFSMCLCIPLSAQGTGGKAVGFIKPKGHPHNAPTAVEAGKSCLVDLIQDYTVTGTLSGTFIINYRIMVHGPCGQPPGTYDEEWIAHGTFSGQINDTPEEGKFTYTATVRDGGNVNGTIVFGQGITGNLGIAGNFKDGKLSYKGRVD
ncbi:MAG: hypothetical protein M9954_08190 [Cyclobacteriaceae bacterium]|nr:hypothetical protein [Cyclobacteriaceae bacterium]